MFKAVYSVNAVEKVKQFDTAGEALGWLVDQTVADALAPIRVTAEDGTVLIGEMELWAIVGKLDQS